VARDPARATPNLRATQIMLEKMETIRLYTWDQISSNGFIPTEFTAPFYPNVGSSSDADRGSGITYYGKLYVTNAPIDSSYSTNLKLEECMDEDVLIVHHWEGQPLPREHGGPARMITPRKYAWKGSKWIQGITFLEKEQLKVKIFKFVNLLVQNFLKQ